MTKIFFSIRALLKAIANYYSSRSRDIAREEIIEQEILDNWHKEGLEKLQRTQTPSELHPYLRNLNLSDYILKLTQTMQINDKLTFFGSGQSKISMDRLKQIEDRKSAGFFTEMDTNLICAMMEKLSIALPDMQTYVRNLAKRAEKMIAKRDPEPLAGVDSLGVITHDVFFATPDKVSYLCENHWQEIAKILADKHRYDLLA